MVTGSTLPAGPTARASGAAQVAEAFLQGYRGSTRDAYRNDLAQWFAFCRALGIRPMTANRTAVDAFVQHLEETEQRAPATIARRLSTLSSFYRWAVREEWVTRNPATLVVRPRVASAAHAPVLDTHALSVLLRAAAEDGPRSDALVALLVFNGLRISEALGASVRDLTTEQDRPVLRVARRGDTTGTVPLAPRTADALARYVGTHRRTAVRQPYGPAAHAGQCLAHCAQARPACPPGPGRPAQPAQLSPGLHRAVARRRREPPGCAGRSRPPGPTDNPAL